MTLTQYRRWITHQRKLHHHCQSCNNHTDDLGESLHPHHLQPVLHLIGTHDPLMTDHANILWLCSHCHTLFHPSCRSYPWTSAAITRSRLFH